MNLAPGKEVTEIKVFEVHFNVPSFDEVVLRQMDKEIPYHILFLLEYDNNYQAWLGYKESTIEANTFKVSEYYHMDWIVEPDISLTLEGLNLDAVYENFVRQIAGDALQSADNEKYLSEIIRRNEQKAYLEKQIGLFQPKIKNAV